MLHTAWPTPAQTKPTVAEIKNITFHCISAHIVCLFYLFATQKHKLQII